MFVEIVMEPCVRIVHDVLFAEFGRVGIVGPDREGDDAHHDDEVGHEDYVAIVGVEEEFGQADGDGERLLAVGIAVLFVVFLGDGVDEGLVGLGDHHEGGLGLRVVGVFVGVVLETHLLVGLFDLLEVGARVDAQDGEGVEAVDLPVGLHGEVEPEEEGGESHGDAEVDQEAGGAQGLEPLAVLLQVGCLLLLGGGAGDGPDGLVGREEGGAHFL